MSPYIIFELPHQRLGKNLFDPQKKDFFDSIDPKRHFAIANDRIAKGLFNHPVGAAEQGWRNGEAERHTVFAFKNGRVINGREHSAGVWLKQR
jgi:hypothetical protein